MHEIEKLRVSVPIIVEGKYDKAAVDTVADATVITTDGFGIFNSKEKKMLIRRLSEKGVIVLCDSDGAGGVIRSHISSLIPKDRIFPVYVPRIEGKEKRKRAPSAEGVLGVEGVPKDVLRDALKRLLDCNPALAGVGSAAVGRKITKNDFYEDGFSGGENSAAARGLLAREVGLPDNMTANALLSAVNMIMNYDGYKAAVERILSDD